MLNRISRQLVLALFWFASAYLATSALLPWEWAWRCAWLNLLIGMTGLLLITHNREGDQVFYQGPKGDQPGLIQVALLWTLPLVGLFVAVLWWLMRLLGFFSS